MEILRTPFGRILGALALLIGLLVSALPAGAQEANSSIEMHSRLCPAGTTDNFFELCHDTPLAGITFGFGGPVSGSITTDGDGNALFGGLFAGTYFFSGGWHAAGDSLYFYCSDSEGNEAPVTWDGTGGSLTVGENQQIVCDAYVIPASTPPTGAEIPSSVTVTVRNCRHGAVPETVVEADCTTVTDGFELSIGSLEGVFIPLTLEDATFDGTSYTWDLGELWSEDSVVDWFVKERPLPDGYTSYVAYGLDDTDVGAFVDHPSGFYPFTVTGSHPNASILILNFAPAPGETPTPVSSAPSSPTVTTLPSTGTGVASPANGGLPIELVLLLLAIGGVAVLMLRARTHR